MGESQFKAVITRDDVGVYVITIEHHRDGWSPRPVGRGGAWTLKGARRKARRLLAKVEREDEYAKFLEVVEP